MTQNIRTFRAASMREALAAVRRALGPDALILGTRCVPAPGLGRLVGRVRVEITAARSGSAAAPPRLRPDGGEAPTTRTPDLEDCYRRLLAGAVAREIARRLVERAAQPGTAADAARVRERLRRLIAGMLPSSGGIALDPQRVRRVALVGPAGSGKSTTVAKLAAHFRLRESRRVAILAVDLDPDGATPAAATCYARAIDVPVRRASDARACAAALADLATAELILLDTPGLSPLETRRAERLAGLLAAALPDEVHLVLPASMSPDAQRRAAQVFARFRPTRLLLTKLDEAVGVGVILNAVAQVELALSYLSAGRDVPHDLIEACGTRLAEVVLP